MSTYHYDVFTEERLPNLNDGEISKEKGAKMLYDALCKKCEDCGMDPKWEVFMTSDHEKYSEIDKGQIWVCWESGPYEWGVGYSLGSQPQSYDWPEVKQDWYLETYYGFDVIFTD